MTYFNNPMWCFTAYNKDGKRIRHINVLAKDKWTAYNSAQKELYTDGHRGVRLVFNEKIKM